jgi:hypothetical protein
MAKADRNASARAAVTGENHAQALSWIRAHGLLHGLAPDAVSVEQQALEAALLFALARPAGPFRPLTPSGSLFGLAKASPGPGDELRLWPVTGYEAEVLARLLPSRTSETVSVTGVAGLRWVRDGKYLALTRVRASGQVLLAAQPRDVREAGRLCAEAGLLPLRDQADTTFEDTPRRLIDISLAESTPAWSRALRRPLLAREVASHWASREPTLAELAGDASALTPRPHGPVSRRPQIVHVRSTKGGTGCSTLSVQIAYGLTRAGRTVALVTDDAMLRQVAKDAADDAAVWHEPFTPAGAGRLLAASHGYFGEHLDVRAKEATSRGEIVILDAGDRPPAELADLPAADLTVLTDHYRARDWVQVDVIDHRPEQIRVFAALDEHFAQWRRPSAEQLDADRLRTALNLEFFYYAMLRLEDPDEVDVYDVDDAEDAREWWDHLGADGSPGHPDDVLPPEDGAPLDLWRRHFLDFITPEGQRRHPDSWDEVRDSWIAHNRLRNRQRLSPDGEPIEDLAVRASEFLATVASEADLQPRAATMEEQETWRTARLMRWLDARFTAHLRHDAAYLPRSAAETVMAVLDARFLTYGPHHAEGFAALADEVTGDDWWDAAAAARSLDGASFPFPPGPNEDADVREQGWAAFLAAVEDEGARRHGEVWSEVRAHWVEHHRRLEQNERAPFAPAEEEVPALRQRFAAILAPIAGAEVDWDSVIGQWVTGVRSDAARVRDFDGLIERRQRPATGEETATALLRSVRAQGLDPQMPVVLITNMYRPLGGPEAVTEAAAALRGHGVVALCTVRQHQAFHEPLFAPAAWNDKRVKPVQEELGAVLSSALKDAQEVSASGRR